MREFAWCDFDKVRHLTPAQIEFLEAGFSEINARKAIRRALNG